MASSWRTTLGAWVFAGTLTYYLWFKPSRDLIRELQEKGVLADPFRPVETRKPVADPQVNGLIYGNKNKENSNRTQD